MRAAADLLRGTDRRRTGYTRPMPKLRAIAVLFLPCLTIAGFAAVRARGSTHDQPAPLPPAPAVAVRPAARPSAAAPVFPVANGRLADVVSHFGDDRDGGVRMHIGIDIAAPRGTPVLAVTSGTIAAVENTTMGGRVVWLQESGSQRRHYYAHLDRILVADGQQVKPGDTIGTVGTTGNAAGGPPHLHYAVRIGSDALDPQSWLRGRQKFEAARAGDTLRTRVAGAALKDAPRGRTLAVLRAGEPVTVLATSGRLYRVRHHGHEGYIADWLLER